jgi:hypothetical protein
MPVKGDELATMSTDEVFAIFKTSTCVFCGTALHETTTGCRQVAEGCSCSDCYFRVLSEHIERKPICVPRMHRGA